MDRLKLVPVLLATMAAQGGVMIDFESERGAIKPLHGVLALIFSWDAMKVLTSIRYYIC